VKRWMIAAALGLAAAGGVVAPGTAQASSSAWHQVYQANASGSFFQIAAISNRNIWAVGDTSTKTGKTIYQPFVRHFNGISWQAIAIPHSSGSTADWVSASSASNVWVGGRKDSSTAISVIYRWNGARWSRIPVPAMTYLQDVDVLGPDNVWAFGDSGTVAYDIFHWNGSKWQHFLPDNTNFIPQDISASAANNVWISGFAYSGRKQVVAAYRWNGTAWHAVSMPHPTLNDGGPDVTAVSPSNVWIGWYDTTTSHALHWDGHQWRTVSLSYYADPTDIVPDGKGGYWFGPLAILSGTRWTSEDVPGFSGDFGDVARIQGTTSFLLNAGVQVSGSSTAKPTIFRFDL
jgi:hypothetical protein